MPPARRRPRAYDPARTRAAVLAQFQNVRAAVRTLTPGQLALPTRLGDWTVRELVAHVGMALTAVDRLLDEPEPARQDGRLLDWPSAIAADADAIAGTARRLAADHPGLDAHLADVERRFTERLDTHPGGRLLPTSAGALPLADYVVTRAVELVVHTDDLTAAVPGLDIPLDRQALAAATRLLADALAAKAPGASTEVRIPPYAVVQCVEGPRHTRGTPPNVVETDPLTWVRLAAGRLTWKDAVAGAKLSASGERADLGALLPLLG
ncbi:maleylpyruvate isomerase family mycothiol-dependent enzyme [Streptomyces parvulus]|uniref:maleylpyruvate isomerase family mycothiol-dependent enzyme n=1 Tax=Streptomyces parvulus TaxID=146923 RepID=UPI0033FF9CA3